LSVIPAYRYGLRREQLSGDAGLRREHAAERILHRYLRQATDSVSRVEFYAAAQTGLSNYLCDKLRVPRGVQTTELIEALRESSLNASTIEKTALFFKRCHEARFMPGGFTPEGAAEDYRLLKVLLADLTVLRRRRHLPKSVAVIALLLGLGSLHAVNGADVWKAGVQAYQGGDFTTAAEKFHTLDSLGISNVPLYVNLGNAYYRQGRIGMAIVNYKRALRLEPSDPAARQSLAFALTRTVEAQSSEPTDAMLRFLQHRYYAVPLNLLTWLWLLLTLITVGWLNVILIRYRGRDKTAPLFALTLLIGLWALWGSVTILRWVEFHHPDEGVVTASTVTASTVPGASGNAFTLHEGFIVKVTAREKNDLRIKLPNGLVGWVPANAVTPVKP
jgi:tetratricopeptide (TPR) repeat protein